MWYDELINLLKNAKDEFWMYVCSIADGDIKYEKEQLVEIFVELLSATDYIAHNSYENIIRDLANYISSEDYINGYNNMQYTGDFGKFAIPWYGEVRDISMYTPSQLALHLYKNISNYKYEQIAILLKSLTNVIEDHCTDDELKRIYNEVSESIIWLHSQREIESTNLIVECGKYALLGINYGIHGYLVVSDYNQSQNIWVNEKRFDATDSCDGMTKVTALKNASDYLYKLVNN